MKDESAGWLGALVVIGVFLVVGGRVKCVISGILWEVFSRDPGWG